MRTLSHSFATSAAFPRPLARSAKHDASRSNARTCLPSSSEHRQRRAEVAQELGIGRVRVTSGELLPAQGDTGGRRSLLGDGSRHQHRNDPSLHDDRNEQIPKAGVLGPEALRVFEDPREHATVVRVAIQIMTVLELERGDAPFGMNGEPIILVLPD